jgi:hypothetical protein
MEVDGGEAATAGEAAKKTKGKDRAATVRTKRMK